MRWTEAVIPLRISRDDRFATLYPAQTLASWMTARSTCSLSRYRINMNIFLTLCQLLLDTTITLLLVVIAFVFACGIQFYISPGQSWLDVIWLWIGLAPCFYYMRYRGIGEFNYLDIVVFIPIPLAAALISFALHPLLAVFAFLYLLPRCLRFRAFLNGYEYVNHFAEHVSN